MAYSSQTQLLRSEHCGPFVSYCSRAYCGRSSVKARTTNKTQMPEMKRGENAEAANYPDCFCTTSIFSLSQLSRSGVCVVTRCDAPPPMLRSLIATSCFRYILLNCTIPRPPLMLCFLFFCFVFLKVSAGI